MTMWWGTVSSCVRGIGGILTRPGQKQPKRGGDKEGIKLRRPAEPNSPILESMNRYRALRFGRLIVAVGGAVVAMLRLLIDTFLELVGSAEVEPANDRRFLEAEMTGEYNHRTRKLDAGTDPYGWYDDD